MIWGDKDSQTYESQTLTFEVVVTSSQKATRTIQVPITVLRDTDKDGIADIYDDDDDNDGISDEVEIEKAVILKIVIIYRPMSL